MRSEAEIQAFIEQLDNRLQKLTECKIEFCFYDLHDVGEASYRLASLQAEYKCLEAKIDVLKWALSEPFSDDIPF